MSRALWNSFYRGRKVLVTGHTGFKGSWLSLWLSSLGAEVHGFSLPAPTDPSLFEEAQIHDLLESSTIGDIREGSLLRETVARIQPEVVFHLAAQPLVRLSYRQPVETFETNVMGVVNLLEAVRECPSVRVCQIITSDKCYENDNRITAFREDDPMGGSDPYSASKGCAELVVSAYRKSFFGTASQTSIASVRAGNVIGGGDWAEDRIVPDCIRAFQKQESVHIRNPHAIRPWQHVLEPLSGYLHLAYHQFQNPQTLAEGWNFGPGPGANWTVRQVVDALVAQWSEPVPPPRIEAPVTNKLYEASFLKLDISKAATLLNWLPILTTAEALKMTAEWYANRALAKAAFQTRSCTLKQIADYEAGLAKRTEMWAS
jgi:CDP-glucose 4,6-dehydratase